LSNIEHENMRFAICYGWTQYHKTKYGKNASTDKKYVKCTVGTGHVY
jgi:hypothetical protein